MAIYVVTKGLGSGIGYLKDEYEIFHIIGQGGSGKVFKGTRKCNNLPVALKVLSKIKVQELCFDEETLQYIPLEFALLSQCQDVPGVIKLYEIVELEEHDAWCMIMERNPNSIDLFEYIIQNSTIQEDTAVYILTQLLHTLIGCHDAGVAHRDIKDENIMIDVTTKEIRLIDFGSGHYYHEEEYLDYNGTAIYCPPEWINDCYYYVKELETWSIGALLFNMITGDIPFKTNEQIINSQLYFLSGSTECQDLIFNCLCKERDKRIQFDNLLSHKFFKKYCL